MNLTIETPTMGEILREEFMIPMNAAESLNDLRVPPGNHLEALYDDRKGQYSIRINQQYRICFIFADGNCENVEIVDYH